ncbi:MAG: DUF4328 domain-containing protein [Bacteroidales bacterium]|nr:DUF4328 domain-containing protein [Bacteroidales bacterium]
MKKISNNVFLGRLTQILNVAVLVLFVLSIVFLLKFDKVNVVKVGSEPSYLKAKEHLHSVEHPLKQNQAEVDYYAYKLDTLSKHQSAVAKDKKAVKSLQEDIDRTKKTLSEKQEALAQTEKAIAEEKVLFEPIEAEYNDLVDQTSKAEGTFSVVAMITLVLFLIKIVVWAVWTYKNSKSLRGVCPWMTKAAAPSWAFWGWIIPVYNLIKPYTFFNELYEETEYALTDKNIVPEDSKGDNDFLLGFWWGMLLFAVCLCNFILLSAFFGEGPAFYKLNHNTVAVVAIIFWLVYVLMEVLIVGKYNKMNKMMLDNEDKF